MGLLGGIDSIGNAIRNPFDFSVSRTARAEDFPDGLLIEELTGPKKQIRLVGNMMPQNTFDFGGEQRIKNDYYAGHSEPVTQVLGPKEKDVVISGVLKDRRYAYSDENQQYYGASTEVQQLIDSIRIRGNLCRFVLGEWERYGYLKETAFQMKKLSYVSYDITFSISGFSAPSNAKFLEKQKTIPFDINEDIINQIQNIQSLDRPISVPVSIADALNVFVSAIAEIFATIDGLMAAVKTAIQDIQKLGNRILGLVKNLVNKAKEYKKFLSSLDPFDPFDKSSLTGRYDNAKYYSTSISAASSLQNFLNKFKEQLNDVINNDPQQEYIVRAGDTLQSIAQEFLNDSSRWKEVYDFNELASTDLTVGAVIDIPQE